jgi:hypothetical protein
LTARATDPVCAVNASACFAGTCGWGVDLSPAALGDARKSVALCSLPPGAGAGWYVVVVVRALPGVSGASIGYLPPLLRSASPPLLPAMGGRLVVRGSDLGRPGLSTGAVSVGGVAGACAIVSRNDSALECDLPAGTVAAAALVVTVSGQASNPLAVGYRAPALRFISPTHGGSTGGPNLTLVGTDFGGGVPIVTFSLQETRSTRGYTTPPATVLAHNDTCIVVAAPYGVDNGNGTIVTVATHDQTSQSGPRYYIDPPVLTAVRCVGSRPIAGLFTVTLVGVNLYGLLPAFIPTVLFSGAACAVVESSVTPVSLNCTAPPGVGAGINVTLSLLGRQATLPGAMAYNAPWIASIAPNISDARAATVVDVYGTDFAPPPVLDVLVEGGTCAALQYKSASHVVCTLRGGMTLGMHSVQVACAGLMSNAVQLSLVCAAGYFAAEGELCAACPPGGNCIGGTALPYSLQGWYQNDDGTFEACAPAVACAGGRGSPCSVGYVDERCKNCAFKYYRLQDACVACPSFALLYIFLFLIVVAVVVSIAYWLNKKRVNLAALSIGIDFMQVSR